MVGAFAVRRPFAWTLAFAAGCGGAPAPTSPAEPAQPVSIEPVVPAEAPARRLPAAVGGAPLDVDAVPEGRGWHCYQHEVSLSCFRDPDVCAAARQAAKDDEDERNAGEDPDLREQSYLSECAALAEAWCMTLRWEHEDAAKMQCFPGEESCMHDGGYFRNLAEMAEEERREGTPRHEDDTQPRVREASGCALLE